jgi:acyl carrier protein
MTTNDIIVKVNDIIARVLGTDPFRVKPECHLHDDLGADSLDEVEIALEIEKAFNICIKDEHLQNMHTVRDAYKIAIETIVQSGVIVEVSDPSPLQDPG